MDHYDLILVGSGFASSFFLHRYLESASERARVLVLERGERRDIAWQIANRGDFRENEKRFTVNHTPEKPWHFSVQLGGGSNCWWACAPRMLPNDFRLRSTYGVGRDWPVGYDDLERFYCDAEALLGVSDDADAPFPRSRPCPMPPHRFNGPDRVLKEAFPETYFHQPTARPSQPASSGRPTCCNNSVCDACPIDSKFTILNEMGRLFEDPRVRLRTGARVDALSTRGDVVTGVEYDEGGESRRTSADFVALGANALFNPYLLLRSGIRDPLVGRRLHEQAAVWMDLDLAGIDNFQGSTSITGHGYMFYDGEHRRERAGCLMEHHNAPRIRLEPGRWRQRMHIKLIFEELGDDRNVVRFEEGRPAKPVIEHRHESDYSRRGMERAQEVVDQLATALPIERVENVRVARSEAHILGTVTMGSRLEDSVVDRTLLHHRFRNLAVLGGSSFPTAAPAHPTLTICALSLWSAHHIFGGTT